MPPLPVPVVRSTLSHACALVPSLLSDFVWTRATSAAGWTARRSTAVVTLSTGAIILTGGYDGATALNDVWRSDDNGATWVRVVEHADWDIRDGHAAVALPNDDILVLGGTNGAWYNDVWASSDGGASFTEIASGPWSKRKRMCVVVFADGELVLAAGGQSKASATNEVWRSTDSGATWVEMGAHIPWGERLHPACAALPGSNTMVLAGGHDSTSPLPDVWKSEDRGVTWTQQVAMPGGPRTSHGLLATGPASLWLMGGKTPSDAYNADVWTSSDLGASWTKVESGGGVWPPRSECAYASQRDGRVVVLGGSGDNPEGAWNDVWVGALNATWREDDCMAAKPGICTAWPFTRAVTVSLDPSAGAIAPLNLGSATSAVFVYAPPIPTLSWPEERDTFTTGQVRVAVEFNAPVTGLKGSSLAAVTSGSSAGTGVVTVLGGLVQAVGASTTWELEVLLAAAVSECPTGYALSPAGTLCARAYEDLRSRAGHVHNSCGAFTLAAITSPEDLEFVASLRGTHLRRYWSVALRCCRVSWH